MNPRRRRLDVYDVELERARLGRRDCVHRRIYDLLPAAPGLDALYAPFDGKTRACLPCHVSWRDGGPCWVCGEPGETWHEVNERARRLARRRPKVNER